MKALVTGAAGFIGRHMVTELESRGWRVYPWDIKDDRDVLDYFPLGVGGPFDLIVHCAAMSPHRLAIDNEPRMHPYNMMLDAAMFDWAIRSKQRRVLYFSSCAAADGPVDGYAATKLAGEAMAIQARKAGVPVTIVRPYSGYGEDQSEDFPFRALIERARHRDNPFHIWGDGQQVRDWIHVEDVVNGALAVVDCGTIATVPLCTGVGTSIIDLATMACTEVGYEPEFLFRLDRPAGTSVRVGDPSLLHQYYVPMYSVADGVKRALEVRHVGAVRDRQ